jgi:hypothetical protein
MEHFSYRSGKTTTLDNIYIELRNSYFGQILNRKGSLMISFEGLRNDVDMICKDLIKLVRTPGPSHAISRISARDPRIEKEFPMTETVKEIIASISKEDKTNISVREDHGNIVLVGGLQSKRPTENEIRSIPITIGAHLDEVTYLISNKKHDGYRELIPLCSPPTAKYIEKEHPFKHEEARIFGFRRKKFISLGSGRFYAKREKTVDKRTKEISYGNWNYLLEINEKNAEIHEGDIVIQDYGTTQVKKHYDIDSTISAKALDDRVGSIVAIYALRYLVKSKPPIPIKVILAGDEEGVGIDVSWARLVRPTYERFCKRDVITLMCDGVDGWNLHEFEKERKNEMVSEALLVPYTSYGKGAGDYGLFSLIRDEVVPLARTKGNFQAETTTDYVSRSFDPKIMNDFPLIAFLDWSNGKVGDMFARCHVDETVKVEQILNLIGMMVYTVQYLNRKKK